MIYFGILIDEDCAVAMIEHIHLRKDSVDIE